MAAILGNLRTTIHISLALALIFFGAYAFAYDSIGFSYGFWTAVARWRRSRGGSAWPQLLSRWT